jgi:hypothetical protein
MEGEVWGDLRYKLELDAWDVFPVVFVALRDHKLGSNCNEIDRAIVMVMVMMRDLRPSQFRKKCSDFGLSPTYQ